MILFKRFSLILSLGFLVAGLAATFLLPKLSRSVAHHENLLDSLPSYFEGWEVRDIPIAESEEMKKAVNELLNFEKAIFREYKKGGRVLQVYAAYWSPRKFHPRLIADHTPDVCWVSNGWRMSKPNYAYQVPSNNLTLQHAQYRLFEANGAFLNVIYWHVVDGRLSGYAEGVNTRSNKFTDDVISSIKNGSGEQFFIRLSSPQSWDEWRGDPLYEEIIRVFSPVLKLENVSEAEH
jgi:hypothetical protein